VADEPFTLYDGDDADAYCDGDPHPDDINWSKVAKVQSLIDEAQALPEGDERNMANLALLSELHGDDLELI
jgi:hypothetical protein